MILENLTNHIEDIIKSLNTDSEQLDKKELEKELKKFLEYGVPIEQAKKTIIKKFGGDIIYNDQLNTERTLISKLQPNDHNVNLICRVISINPKEILVKGENRKIFYGILGDESGTIPFTAWNNIEIEKEDVIEISNAYTREWQGNIQLNFGDRANIEKTDKNKLPPEAFKPKKVKVNELKSGIGSVDIIVLIIEINKREVEVNGEKKTVFSGIIGDETGKAQFTSWFDFKLKKDQNYKIKGGYVKTWKGIPQLTFDENSNVKKLDKNIITKDKIKTKKMLIHELIDKKGAIDINVEGTIIEIREGSGIINRCPQCNRALKNGECTIHGKIEGKSDLRIKLIIDDGTGAISTVYNKKISEKLLNKTLEDYEKMNQDEVIKEIIKKLFSQRVLMNGNTLSDEFGTTLIAKDADIINIDIKQKSEKLLQELEELQ
jgi:replication factor A1